MLPQAAAFGRAFYSFTDLDGPASVDGLTIRACHLDWYDFGRSRPRGGHCCSPLVEKNRKRNTAVNGSKDVQSGTISFASHAERYFPGQPRAYRATGMTAVKAHNHTPKSPHGER